MLRGGERESRRNVARTYTGDGSAGGIRLSVHAGGEYREQSGDRGRAHVDVIEVYLAICRMRVRNED